MKESLTDKTLMIKTLIGLAYLDHELSLEEKGWFESLISNHITDFKVVHNLHNELKNPSLNYENDFKKIKSPFIRRQVLDFSRYLFNLDDDLSVDEKDAFKKLKDIERKLSVDLSSLEREIANEMVKELNGQAIYKDIKELGHRLSKPLDANEVVKIGMFPSLSILSLFRSGKFGRLFAICLVFLSLFLFIIKTIY